MKEFWTKSKFDPMFGGTDTDVALGKYLYLSSS